MVQKLQLLHWLAMLPDLRRN